MGVARSVALKMMVVRERKSNQQDGLLRAEPTRKNTEHYEKDIVIRNSEHLAEHQWVAFLLPFFLVYIYCWMRYHMALSQSAVGSHGARPGVPSITEEPAAGPSSVHDDSNIGDDSNDQKAACTHTGEVAMEQLLSSLGPEPDLPPGIHFEYRKLNDGSFIRVRVARMDL